MSNPKIYDTNSTKQEERQALTDFARRFANGSYLYDFFKPELLNWLDEQIHNDFVPDLWGYLESAKQEALDHYAARNKAEQAMQNLQQQNDQLTKDFEDFEERAGNRINSLKELIETRDNQIDSLNMEHSREQEKFEELQDQLHRECQAHEEEVQRLYDQITRLKAEVYDLQKAFQQVDPYRQK